MFRFIAVAQVKEVNIDFTIQCHLSRVDYHEFKADVSVVVRVVGEKLMIFANAWDHHH